MSRSFLFGGNASSSSSKYLVEFKAGRLEVKDGGMVTPVKRKGLCYMHQAGDDNLMHFCWKDRESGSVGDDFILFPNDAEFVKVPQCKTGRVFLLKFKAGRRCFYWMQEPQEDKDEEIFKKVNDLISNPPPASSRSSNSGGLGNIGNLGNINAEALRQLGGELGEGADLTNLLNNMNPQQLIQMLGGIQGVQGVFGSQGSGRSAARAARQSSGSSTSGGASVTTASSSPPAATPVTSATESKPAQPQIQLADLRSIISSLTVPGQQPQGSKEEIDLSTAINSEALQTLVSNEEFMNRVTSFLPTVASADPAPEPAAAAAAANPSENLSSTVKSPQFKQALRTFSTALQSGQLGPLMHQFELSQACVDAANEGDMEKFVKALEESEKNKKSSGAKQPEEGNKDDEMALD